LIAFNLKLIDLFIYLIGNRAESFRSEGKFTRMIHLPDVVVVQSVTSLIQNLTAQDEQITVHLTQACNRF